MLVSLVHCDTREGYTHIPCRPSPCTHGLKNEHLRAYSEKTVPSLIRLGTISPNASKMLLNAWYGHCCGSSILGLGPGDLDLETLHGVDPPAWVWRGPSSIFGWLGDWFDSV